MARIRRKLIAFVHIEKTAGTSMVHILRHNFPGRYLDVRPMAGRDDRTFRAEDLRLALRVNPFLAAIGGHSVIPQAGLEELAEVSYITLLRDPVKRYISQYRYWRSSLGKSMSPEDYFALDHAADKQVNKIAGESNVQKAIDLLEDRFLAYGIVEQFGEFVGVMANRLNTGFEAVSVTRNRTGQAPFSAEELMARYGDTIRERNRHDQALYDYVRDAVAKRSVGRSATPIRSLSRPSGRLYLDYALRKLYYEPVTGLIRKAHGMPAAGSY